MVDQFGWYVEDYSRLFVFGDGVFVGLLDFGIGFGIIVVYVGEYDVYDGLGWIQLQGVGVQ